MEFPVAIIDNRTGELVEGTVRPARPSDKVLWTHWHGEMRPDAEDGHWEWDDFMDLAIALPGRFEVYVLESVGELQGLRMLEIEGPDVNDWGVHALRLSTAPWNRPPDRRYSGVGSILVGLAIIRSVELGYEGNTYCESLPGAEEFHTRNGMKSIKGRSNEGLKRFRFTADAGSHFLTGLRNDGLIR